MFSSLSQARQRPQNRPPPAFARPSKACPPPTAKPHRLSATGKRFRLMTRVQPRHPPTSATIRIGHDRSAKSVNRNPANVTLNIVLSPRASADTGILTSAPAYQTILLNSPEICVPYQIARNLTVSSSNIPPKTHLRPTRGRTHRNSRSRNSAKF